MSLRGRWDGGYIAVAGERGRGFCLRGRRTEKAGIIGGVRGKGGVGHGDGERERERKREKKEEEE